MAYKEIVGQPVAKLDENNKTMEGVLVEIENGAYGPQFRMKLTAPFRESAAGEEIVLGNQTVLESKILPKHKGKQLKVEWVGLVKSGKSRYSYIDYKVYVNE